jgi:hypothetical protein
LYYVSPNWYKTQLLSYSIGLGHAIRAIFHVPIYNVVYTYGLVCWSSNVLWGPTPYPIKSLISNTYTRLHNITARSAQRRSLNLTLGRLARVGNAGDVVIYPDNYSLIIDTDAKAMEFHVDWRRYNVRFWAIPSRLGNPRHGAIS